MKTSTKRILSIFLTGLLFLLALIFYVNLVKPEYADIQNLRASLAARSVLFDEQKEIISNVKNLLSQYESAAQLQETISLAMPLGEGIAELFQQIFALSQLSGLSIQSFNLKTLALKPNNLGTIQLDLRLAGSYGALKTFIRSAETNIRVMDLSNLRIQPAGKPEQDLYRHDLTINAYYQQ